MTWYKIFYGGTLCNIENNNRRVKLSVSTTGMPGFYGEHKYLNWGTDIQLTLTPFSNRTPLPPSPLHHGIVLCQHLLLPAANQGVNLGFITKSCECVWGLVMCVCVCVVLVSVLHSLCCQGSVVSHGCLQTTCPGPHLSHHHHHCPPEVPVYFTKWYWFVI